MTDRKIFGPFSSAQVTLMVCAAILAPGAVYATTALTSVVITEPASGRQSWIDSSRRLYTYDPVAGYANNPANVVNIVVAAPVSGPIYTVPAGKALIIKSAAITYYNGTSGADNYVYIESNTSFLFGFDTLNVDEEHNFNFDSGIVLHSNTKMSCQMLAGTPANSVVTIQGYLVPSGAVPALGTQEAAEQLVTVGTLRKK